MRVPALPKESVPKLQVREDAANGRGIYALSRIEEDSVVLKDVPIAVGSLNRPEMACAVCKTFVGSVQLHLHVLANAFELTNELCKEKMTKLPLMETAPVLPELSSQSTGYLTKFPHSSSPSVICSQKCCDILLIQANDIFGEGFAEEVEELDMDHLVLVGSLLGVIHYRLTQQETLSWEAAIDDIFLLNPVVIKEDMEEAYSLVMKYFPATHSKALSYLNDNVTIDVFKKLLGIVQANAVGVQLPSPIVRYFATCEAPELLIKNASSLVQSLVNSQNEDKSDDESSDDDDDEADESMNFIWPQDGKQEPLTFTSNSFPHSTGMALFPAFSMLNHSCAPNCTLTYVDSTSIMVFALNDIAPGDELTISYVEQDMPIKDRRAELQERYGFHCKCVRCLAEEKSKKKKTKRKREEKP